MLPPRRLLPVAVTCAALAVVATLPGAAPAGAASYRYDVPLAPSSPWPKFRRDSRQSGLSPVIPRPGGGRPWSYRTGLGIFSSPVIGGDGTIYVGSADRYLYALRPDGRLRWRFRTGEIIDSAALLDDRGRIYVGSGDGHLYALDARTGRLIWRFAAEDPDSTGAFIDWFEGNVAIGPGGTLYAPNDNFRTYALDRDTRAVRWAFRTPDQTWSLPAVDVARGRLAMGSNFFFAGAKNTFALDAATGAPAWQDHAEGAVVASPLITPDHQVVVGAFDGFVRSYDEATGRVRWRFGTRDHIYASPARQPDGTIVQASADGSVYGLDPGSGRLRWQFDTLDPIRSSPAVDGRGNVYVGSGDGRLIVLNRNGTLRWSIRLARPPRGTLNASPALGTRGVAIADSNGDIHFVPYDWCLRRGGRADRRCRRGPRNPLPGDGARLYAVSPFGLVSTRPPARIDPNQPIALQLVVRRHGRTLLAFADPARLRVRTEPRSPLRVSLSGDRRYVVLTPNPAYRPRRGVVRLSVSGTWLGHPRREGLAFSGGRAQGRFSAALRLRIRPADGPRRLPLPVPRGPGDRAGVWRVERTALSLPDLLPSYNQIGFDRLTFLLGLVERSRGGGAVVWMAGARRAGRRVVADPSAKWLVPFRLRYDRGLLGLTGAPGATFELNGFENKTLFWRIAGRLDRRGAAIGAPRQALSINCADIGFYGVALQGLGQCTKTRPMAVFGAALLSPEGSGVQRRPAGVGRVSFGVHAGRLEARLAGSALRPARQSLAVLALDASTGEPLALDYSYGTKRETDSSGRVTQVSVPLSGRVPRLIRAYLMVGAYPAARGAVRAR
ncbi:MAG: PQQ-binding-like beta-propeller repeat protein [Solirubrobacteraceae bacterium]